MTGEYLIALLGFGAILMIYGIKLKMGLLNILTLPLWIYLAIDKSDSALMVILFTGLSFLQIYLVFWGYRYD